MGIREKTFRATENAEHFGCQFSSLISHLTELDFAYPENTSLSQNFWTYSVCRQLDYCNSQLWIITTYGTVNCNGFKTSETYYTSVRLLEEVIRVCPICVILNYTHIKQVLFTLYHFIGMSYHWRSEVIYVDCQQLNNLVALWPYHD